MNHPADQHEQGNSCRQPAAGGPTLIIESAGQRYGLPVESVLKVAAMVSITRLPKAPDFVSGVIDFHGQVIPVIDLRWRLQQPIRPYTLRIPLVISRLNGRTIALAVDAVRAVVELQPSQVQPPAQVFPPALQTFHLLGLARLDDGIVLLLDPQTFLSPAEETSLQQTLPRGEASP